MAGDFRKGSQGPADCRPVYKELKKMEGLIRQPHHQVSKYKGNAIGSGGGIPGPRSTLLGPVPAAVRAAALAFGSCGTPLPNPEQ